MSNSWRSLFSHDLGAWLSALDWDQLRAEVKAEARAQIDIVGRKAVGKSELYNQLKGWSASAVSVRAEPIESSEQSAIEKYGLFNLVTLPEEAPDAELLLALPHLQTTHLILYVLDGAAGLTPADFRWFCCLRALGKPLMVVLNKLDLAATPDVAHEMTSARVAMAQANTASSSSSLRITCPTAAGSTR